MDACPDLETLAAYLDGLLSERERTTIAEHVAGCETCYFVFTETAQTKATEASRPSGGVVEKSNKASPDPFSWSWKQPRVWVPAVVLAASFVLAIRIGVVPWPGSESSRLRSLVAAVGTDRMIEARLSGGFAYGRLRGALRSSQSSASVSPDLRIAAAEIERDELGRRTPQSLRILGLAYLTTGEVARAVAALEQSADQPSPSSETLSDLAAAYIVRASSNNQPEDLRKALTVADRAVKVDPTRAEAWFNKALALEGLGLTSEARGAWRDYLRVDVQSAWAAEAQEHLQRLEGDRR
jgi:hypothetical protein